MADKAADKLKEQESVSVDRIAEISSRIREAVRAALPAPMEQFFTVMVPGKVLNLFDYMDGFDETDGSPTSTILPTVTELNQAKLCDDMPALAGVQLGPSGRAVSRSYAATLAKLVPKGTTVGVEVADPSKLTDQEKRYKKAMDWLCAEDPDTPGMSHVEIYVEKQQKYTEVVEKKQKAFNAALKAANEDPANKTLSQKRAAYDLWVNENARTYRNYVQAAYMDWVITGKKEAVEYWFSIVDMDSAMARVEQSKEAMRASTVMDSDGSVEYQKVKLDPSNWAWLAYKKAYPPAGAETSVRTPEWYTWEISRLQKLNRMLSAIKETPPLFKDAKGGQAVSVPELTVADADSEAATKKYITARNSYQAVQNNPKSLDKDKKDALNALGNAREEMSKAMAECDKANIGRLKAQGQQAQDEIFEKLASNVDEEIKTNNDLITDYDNRRKELLAAKLGNPVDAVSKELGLPPKSPDPEAPPAADAPKPAAAGAKSPPKPVADFWTSITAEVEASYEYSESTQKSQSTSVGASGGWGGFRAGGSGAHTKSSADAESQMAKSSVKVSFECMRVDISRNWLRAELFYDDDLTVAPGNYISPGFSRLGALMDPENYKETPVGSPKERQDELIRYSTFPIYPTAFLLACNVVLEISGETASIQSHFSTSTTTASASAGWGPFAVNVSHSQSETHTAATCETTASGCRITMKAPQIIGWISQMVPALPRLSADTGLTTPATTGTTTTVAQSPAQPGDVGVGSSSAQPPA